MKNILRILLALLILTSAISVVTAQVKQDNCPTCGKPYSQCPYHFNHPAAPKKCSTCGKIIDKCPYKGKHFKKCISCGKEKNVSEFTKSSKICNACVAREKEIERKRLQEQERERQLERERLQEQERQRKLQAQKEEEQRIMDEAEGKRLYKKGLDYFYGDNGCSEDRPQAFSFFRQAVEKGNTDAMIWLGYCYESGNGVAHDRAQALKWFRKSAEMGNAYGMIELGSCYERGYGVTQDIIQAMSWYQKAAEKGEVEIYIKLASTTRDDAKEREWLQQAVDMGSARAMYLMGLSYEICGIPDYPQAFSWFKKAADLGNTDAMMSIAAFYERGRGVPQDYDQALKWYHYAADLGDADALFRIGISYKNGYLGLKKDKKKARDFLQKAADKGHSTAQEALKKF